MNSRQSWLPLAVIAAVFLFFFYFPFDSLSWRGPLFEALALTQWYAREHVILCLVPAFFIAGAIAVFIRQEAVMRYLGPTANKLLSYGVASVSGSVLAVCSCTVLPLFAGIYRMGAGLGPATAFLYAGPAINVLAIILTARILGLELGVARAVGAVVFSIIVGLLMHLFFRKDEQERLTNNPVMPESQSDLPLWKTALYFGSMVAILVFANWGSPDSTSGVFSLVFRYKWWLTSLSAIGLGVMLSRWYGVKSLPLLIVGGITALLAALFPEYHLVPFGAAVVGLSIILLRQAGAPEEWFDQTYGFTRQIMPLLFGGVLVAGLLLGRPGYEGVIPSDWIAASVGGNSMSANLFASVVGAFMYFATLTEIPILQGLIGNGMGKGPALALLLAGPALSLPNMLVIRSVIGTKKTIVFVALVIAMATLSGIIYGSL